MVCDFIHNKDWIFGILGQNNEKDTQFKYKMSELFDLAHQKRNLAEYEGYLEIEESTIKELRELTSSLMKDVEKLVKKQ